MVDAGNLASLETLMPIGIYDLELARPPFTARLSRGGEVFKPIGGRGSGVASWVPSDG